MRKIIILSIITLSALVLAGCRTAKTATEIVTQLSHDTIYLSNIQYDSIFIQNDHSQEYHPYIVTTTDTDVSNLLRTDTIHIKDISVQYKYKLLRDTIYKVKTDSIPVVKEVTVTKEVKYIPWYSKLLSWIGAILLITLIIYIIYRIIKWKTNI